MIQEESSIMTKIEINTPLANAVLAAYREGQNDEVLEPLLLINEEGNSIGRIKINDGLIFANIRGEREVELSQALIKPDFEHFHVEYLNLKMATMIQYHPDLHVEVAFPPSGKLRNNLTEVLYQNGKKVLKIVESEKSIHLTYFFNGKQHKAFPNEDRIIIPSHESENLYDHPEMKAKEVTDITIREMEKGMYHLIVTNISPCDVMGHIEKKEVIKKAIHTVDYELRRVIDSALNTEYTVIVTADHGLAEKWLYPDGSIDTGHSSSPVPFLLIDTRIENPSTISLQNNSSLIDIAPTVLTILDVPIPSEMEGSSILASNGLKNNKVLLLILDGWGYNPDPYGNLFMEAGTPNMNFLQKNFPFTTLTASGLALGMPEGTVGNSEIGHLHIGAGRRIVSDRVRIFDSITDHSFYQNPAFLMVIEHAKKHNSSLHILGIISFYSSHGSIKYLEALLDLAKRQNTPRVYLHGMLGRRGEKPEAGALYVQNLELLANKLGNAKVVSIIGRHWALDREYNWDRIEKTYDLLVRGKGKKISEIMYWDPSV